MGLQKRQMLVKSVVITGLAVATAAVPVFAQSNPEPMTSPVAVPEQASTSEAALGTIVDVAASNPDFSTLVTAVKAAGLVETLSGKGPFTVFAPTNEAFAALPAGALDTLLKPENKAKLQAILTYHVVPGAIPSENIKPGEVKTVEGKSVNLAITDKKVTVNRADVVTADVKASNGIIHAVDKVLFPPDVKTK